MMSIIRICVVGLAVIAEFILLGLIVISLQRYSYLIFIGLEVVSIVAALVLANGRTGSSYTTAWLFLILILPVFGFLLYLLWGRSGTDGKKRQKAPRSPLSGGSIISLMSKIHTVNWRPLIPS